MKTKLFFLVCLLTITIFSCSKSSQNENIKESAQIVKLSGCETCRVSPEDYPFTMPTFNYATDPIKSFIESEIISDRINDLALDLDYANGKRYNFNNGMIGYEFEDLSIDPVNGKRGIFIYTHSNTNNFLPVLFTTNANSTDYAIAGLVSGGVYIDETSDFINGEEEEEDPELCNEKTNNFDDCMECAWDDMNSDWQGEMFCSFNTLACWVACGIHCSIGKIAADPTLGTVLSFQHEYVDGNNYIYN